MLTFGALNCSRFDVSQVSSWQLLLLLHGAVIEDVNFCVHRACAAEPNTKLNMFLHLLAIVQLCCQQNCMQSSSADKANLLSHLLLYSLYRHRQHRHCCRSTGGQV
jgi:hypothetical protein